MELFPKNPTLKWRFHLELDFLIVLWHSLNTLLSLVIYIYFSLSVDDEFSFDSIPPIRSFLKTNTWYFEILNALGIKNHFDKRAFHSIQQTGEEQLTLFDSELSNTVRIISDGVITFRWLIFRFSNWNGQSTQIFVWPATKNYKLYYLQIPW